MADDHDRSQPYRLWPLDRRILVGGSVIGAVVAAITLSFAYAGGLFSLGRLTQEDLIDTFQDVNGVFSGFRRNHAKGVCVTGYFDSNGNGTNVSKAAVFEKGHIPVTGRFSLAGGKPYVADSKTDIFALAVSFRPPDGEEWRTAMVDIPVFPVRDAAGFRDLLLASEADPATGKPDPAKMKAFLAAHSEAPPALELITARALSSGFDTASYNALNAFRFVNGDGTSTSVRWSMIAVDPAVAAVEPAAAPAGEPTAEPAAGSPVDKDKNFLFDALIARIERGPAQWHLVLTLGQSGDPTGDASLPWPPDRERADVGTLTFDHAETESPGNCRDINFDPLVLPSGIEPSDDPLLSARSAAYSISYTRRAGEEKTPSEVQVPATNKGS
ncbi:MAG: catalase family peroxidase [Rhodospirillales bacterium]|nr:catalase family peroxidase [Rhodospirillales bacterium]